MVAAQQLQLFGEAAVTKAFEMLPPAEVLAAGD